MYMVKKIKFALEMKDGVKVRTLEELQDHFDLKTAIGYFLDGKLQKWLEDRYYDEKVEALQQLDPEQPDIRVICNILEVPYAETVELDIDSIQERNEKLDILKQLTDNEDILANSSKVAFSQDELDALLAQGEQTIYLCGDTFAISAKWEHRTYIGVGEAPYITIEEEPSFEKLGQCQISFVNIQVPEYVYSKQSLTEEKQGAAYHREHSAYKVSQAFDFMLNNQQRKASETLFDCIIAGLENYRFDPDKESNKLLKVIEHNLSGYIFDPDIASKKILHVIQYGNLSGYFQHFLERMA